MKNSITDQPADVVLIGAGIMSATLGVLLQRLQPDWHFQIFERLDQIAVESSDAWNNAGTGHAAYCELNYTSEEADGSINISKALKINEQFELSKQFWAFLMETEVLSKPTDFINPIPHLSFVQGVENAAFLKKRHAALIQNHLFRAMQFSDNPAQLRTWMPLMMAHRDPREPVAATYMEQGTDVNFGNLTRQLFRYLDAQPHTDVYLQHEVQDVYRDPITGHWRLTVRDDAADEKRTVLAKFVFIGAGGGALELLNDSNIPEADGYGGFPVSGQWLRCTNPEVIAQHHAKVYGKAAVGTPPMSMPHLDTRVINGKRELLFGPFAGFSTKFLKRGSYFDLVRSIDNDNIVPMLQAGWDNVPLTRYLIGQVLQSPEDRMDALRVFYPLARPEEWVLEMAGQRVQIIKDDAARGGVLEFGTEIVHAADGSLVGLLGASPGASTAVAIMLNLLARCFPAAISGWQPALQEMIPSFRYRLSEEEERTEQERTGRVLGLKLNEFTIK